MKTIVNGEQRTADSVGTRRLRRAGVSFLTTHAPLAWSVQVFTVRCPLFTVHCVRRAH